MSGHWTVRFAGDDVHEGPFVDGKEDGFWISSWASGDRFEGEVRNGLPNGPGTYTFASGNAYNGRFRDGCLRHECGQEIAVWTSRENCGFE